MHAAAWNPGLSQVSSAPILIELNAHGERAFGFTRENPIEVSFASFGILSVLIF
jgi:hypothetical protein